MGGRRGQPRMDDRKFGGGMSKLLYLRGTMPIILIIPRLIPSTKARTNAQDNPETTGKSTKWGLWGGLEKQPKCY